MNFEYDLKKSASNLEKHGIDFEDSKLLWGDPNLLVISAQTVDEPRYLAIGKIHGKYWSAIFTHRLGNIRIISVRRSREKEADLYEST